MSSRKSLLEVPWTEQLAILGVTARDRALPSVVTCPLCQAEHLTVHPGRCDQGGPNAYCGSCKFAGTLLELSAQVWGISAAEAAAKSTDLGVPLLPVDHTDEDLDAVAAALAPLERFRDLWSRAQATVDAEQLGSVRPVLVRAHAQPTAAAGRRYFNVVGAQYGVIACQEVERAFMPNSVRQRRSYRERGFNPSSSRLFSGRGWRDVLVLPRYDSPGRLCAFEFIGRQGNHDDRVTATTETCASDLGLFGLNCALGDTPFGRTVLVLDDALLALRLQTRHAVSASLPLPIVCWADRGAKRTQNWGTLACRKLVFWAREPSARLIRQLLAAEEAGAVVYVTNAGPRAEDDKAFDHFIRLPGDAAAFVGRLERTAAPLTPFLSRWVEKVADGKLEALVRGLLRNDIDPIPLANRLSAEARSRIAAMQPHALKVPPRRAVVGRCTVVENRGGWYAFTRNTSTLLSSVIVRLLSLRDGQYTARLIAGDREIVVQLPAGQRFERVLHTLCATHGLDVTFQRVAGVNLRAVALAFSGSL